MLSEPVLVDTGALIALLDSHDPHMHLADREDISVVFITGRKRGRSQNDSRRLFFANIDHRSWTQ